MTEFWRGKRVLVTGHTGFKGSWLSLWLTDMGAEVYGLALAPETTPALFEQLRLAEIMDHALGDIRDPETLAARVAAVRPEAVFHLAAQPLVLRAYREPLLTWETNVMGTAHLLEALKPLDAPCAAVLATTDKVYENREWPYAYRESDRLGGHDPYSSSKAAMEVLVASFRRSFFQDGHPVRIATGRAGNVIGGGDWSENRIAPDLVRALGAGKALAVRNPAAVRPWQHVLEPLAGYLRLAEALATRAEPTLDGAFNFGPEPHGNRSVRDLVETAIGVWPGDWRDASDPDAPHEAGLLALAIEKARATLGWRPRWDFPETVARTVDWHRRVAAGTDPLHLCRADIGAYGEP